MKIVKVISASKKGIKEVITDEGTTKHIHKKGDKWFYFKGNKRVSNEESIPIFEEIKEER